MKFDVFGKFMMAIGAIFLLIAAIFAGQGYAKDNSKEASDERTELAERRVFGLGYVDKSDYVIKNEVENIYKNSRIFCGIGGAVFLLGFGFIISAKKQD